MGSVSLQTVSLVKAPLLLKIDHAFTLADIIAHGQPIILD